MGGTIEDRFLARWTESRRREDEARRFLARQELGLGEHEAEADALAEVVAVFEEHGSPGLGPVGTPPRRRVTTVGDFVD